MKKKIILTIMFILVSITLIIGVNGVSNGKNNNTNTKINEQITNDINQFDSTNMIKEVVIIGKKRVK